MPARVLRGEGPSVEAEVGGFHGFIGSCKAHAHTAWGRFLPLVGHIPGLSAWSSSPPGWARASAATGLPVLQNHPNKILKMPIKGGSQPVLCLDGTSPVPAWWEVDASQGSYAEGLGREDRAGVVSGCRRPGAVRRVVLARRLSPRVMRPA